MVGGRREDLKRNKWVQIFYDEIWVEYARDKD